MCTDRARRMLSVAAVVGLAVLTTGGVWAFTGSVGLGAWIGALTAMSLVWAQYRWVRYRPGRVMVGQVRYLAAKETFTCHDDGRVRNLRKSGDVWDGSPERLARSIRSMLADSDAEPRRQRRR